MLRSAASCSGIWGLWEILGKHTQAEASCSCEKATGRSSRQVRMLDETESPKITRAGRMVFATLMERPDLGPACACWLSRVRTQQRSNNAWQHFFPREISPLALALKLVNPVLPSVFPAFFKLLPLCWSPKQVSLAEGPLRHAESRSPASPCVTWTQSSLFFTARYFGTLFPGTGAQDCRAICGLETITPQGEHQQLIYLSWFSTDALWVRDLPVPCLGPSYQSHCAFFFILLVVVLLFS